MRRILLITALVAACTPLSEAERDARTYEQQEHEAAWAIYEDLCHRQGGKIFRNNPLRPRRPVPEQHEWRHWYGEDGVLHWNSASVFCIK